MYIPASVTTAAIPFNNMVEHESQHGWIITSIVKCGVKLLIHAGIKFKSC